MILSPLQKKLLPDLADIPNYELAVALFPLRDTFVAEHLLPHPRFKRQILERILAEHNVDLTRSAVPFDKEHILQAILNEPLAKIFRGLGLSWNASTVAACALKDENNTRAYLASLPREEVQSALSFRTAHNIYPATTSLDGRKVETDGLLCFVTWLTDIPQDTINLIDYACVNAGFEFPKLDHLSSDEITARRNICTQWCDQQIARQTDASDEQPEERTEEA
ncbi:MAG: hypothetical protein ABJO67_03545 [Pseudoruegeria sp.]